MKLRKLPNINRVNISKTRNFCCTKTDTYLYKSAQSVLLQQKDNSPTSLLATVFLNITVYGTMLEWQ